jgi:hypothetical protein
MNFSDTISFLPWRGRRQRTLIVGICAVFLLAAAPLSAAVPPLKPYDQLVDEVMVFFFSDVGEGGIRTNDDDPGGYPVPPYFYHYAIGDDNDLWSSPVGYPGYYSVSYPGYTASVAIDAFLDYRRYSGDDEGLVRARAFADWILEHRTPPADLYGNLPYSTQTEGVMGGGWDGEAIMTDKPAMFGLRLLRLYDITGEPAYWQGAEEIAVTLAATQLDGPPTDRGRWPWRVRPSDGLVTQDYTSHLQPALRFFDAMAARTDDPAYAEVRDNTWQWLLDNPCNPLSESYNRWEAFYEDQSPEMQEGKQDHYSAHEMIVELIQRQPAGWQEMAVAILDSAAARYLVTTGLGDYVPVTLEWEGWQEATYASTLQFARTALLLFQALQGHPLQNPDYETWAYDMAAVCSYGQNFRCVTPDGRMFTAIKDILFPFSIESWYEQSFNTVKYYLELMYLDPSLAPGYEHHMLWSGRPVRSVVYSSTDSVIRYEVAGGQGRELLKLAVSPNDVLAAGVPLAEMPNPDDPGPGYHYDTVTHVLTVSHVNDPVEIFVLFPTGLVDDTREVPDAAAVTGIYPNPFNPLTTIHFFLTRVTEVRLAVYDVRGRLVRLLADGVRPAGFHQESWDGRDRQGASVTSGVYFARLEAGGQVSTRKMVLVQ